VRRLRGATGAVAAHSCHQLVSLLHAASPRANLDGTADDPRLHPHVSCVKASHPAAQLDVNPEQRSVRKSMMSRPHHPDRAHIHATFGTPRKFIRARGITPARWSIVTQEAIQEMTTPIEELDRRLRELRRRTSIGLWA
jgi:hypothetical protein